MENNYEYVQETQEKKGSVIGGIIGALLGAGIGAVAWAAVGMLGYIVSLIGFVIAFLADKGYDLFKGRPGTIKMIVLIICVVLAVGVGTLGTAVWSIHNEYTEQYNALSDFDKKYYEIMSEEEFMIEIFKDSEVQTGLVKDSALGLLFGILGSFGLIKAAKDGKSKKGAPVVESNEATMEMASTPVQEAGEEADVESDTEVQA